MVGFGSVLKSYYSTGSRLVSISLLESSFFFFFFNVWTARENVRNDKLIN